jgi:hypothetical protein
LDDTTRQNLIQQHLDAIRKLQAPQPSEPHDAATTWPPPGYYLLWHVVVGMMLGVIGAAVSLAFNAIGAPLAGEHPLQLIRVYLTFPMGAEALTTDSGKVLTVGCILYLITGALYGVVFHLIMSGSLGRAGWLKRLIAGSAIGLGLWVVNFYLVLSWLQPALLGGNWILTEVPWWVAALTHLAFAWTMLVIEFWGRFVPYRADAIG